MNNQTLPLFQFSGVNIDVLATTYTYCPVWVLYNKDKWIENHLPQRVRVQQKIRTDLNCHTILEQFINDKWQLLTGLEHLPLNKLFSVGNIVSYNKGKKETEVIVLHNQPLQGVLTLYSFSGDVSNAKLRMNFAIDFLTYLKKYGLQ
jgi:hypothetical protein